MICELINATKDNHLNYYFTLQDPGGKSKDIASETVYLENEIKIKQECPEEAEEQTFIDSQSITECALCRGDNSDRKESPLSHEVGDQFSPCSTCGHVFGTRPKMKYHMVGIEARLITYGI